MFCIHYLRNFCHLLVTQDDDFFVHGGHCWQHSSFRPDTEGREYPGQRSQDSRGRLLQAGSDGKLARRSIADCSR